jgi:hypothetical protein
VYALEARSFLVSVVVFALGVLVPEVDSLVELVLLALVAGLDLLVALGVLVPEADSLVELVLLALVAGLDLLVALGFVVGTGVLVLVEEVDAVVELVLLGLVAGLDLLVALDFVGELVLVEEADTVVELALLALVAGLDLLVALGLVVGAGVPAPVSEVDAVVELVSLASVAGLDLLVVLGFVVGVGVLALITEVDALVELPLLVLVTGLVALGFVAGAGFAAAVLLPAPENPFPPLVAFPATFLALFAGVKPLPSSKRGSSVFSKTLLFLFPFFAEASLISAAWRLASSISLKFSPRAAATFNTLSRRFWPEAHSLEALSSISAVTASSEPLSPAVAAGVLLAAFLEAAAWMPASSDRLKVVQPRSLTILAS